VDRIDDLGFCDMTHTVQRNGVRLVAFNKSGHTSLIASFMTPPTVTVTSGKRPLEDETLRGGSTFAVRDWPLPLVNIAFFRHPLKRLFSAWNHLTQQHLYGPFKAIGIKRHVTWPDFAEEISSYLWQHTKPDPHVESQYAMFLRVCDIKAPNLFFRLESSADNWERMVEWYDLDCVLRPQILNANGYDSPSYPWSKAYENIPIRTRTSLNNYYVDDLRIWHEVAQT
jgi:hypothetical protein